MKLLAVWRELVGSGGGSGGGSTRDEARVAGPAAIPLQGRYMTGVPGTALREMGYKIVDSDTSRFPRRRDEFDGHWLR